MHEKSLALFWGGGYQFVVYLLVESNNFETNSRWQGKHATLPYRQRVRGGPGQTDKKSSDVFFFVFFSPQLILQKSNGQFQRFSRFQRGSNIFQGRGVQLLIPYRNPYNLWFSRGGPDFLSPPPPPPPLWIRTCKISSMVCNCKTCVKWPLKNRQNKDLNDKIMVA